jgi:UDP-3-O-[3-hydroxymyristoyl] N-acetylglucosamine deacetylase
MEQQKSVELAELSVWQRTLGQPITLSGVELHDGGVAEVRVEPAPVDHGIQFSSGGTGKASPGEYTYGSNFTTSVRLGDKLHMCIEHLMSCLNGLGITNAHIRFLSGREVPILDGSAKEIAAPLLKAGVVDQSKRAIGLHIRKPIELRDERDGRVITAQPWPGFSVIGKIDFPPPIGDQALTVELDDKTYLSEIANARTFLKDSVDKVPLDDVRTNRLHGVGGPAIEDCHACIYDNTQFLTRLRFKDEPVRHKMLDFIGDIYTCGYPVRGQFTIVRPGHLFSLKFAQLLRRELGAPSSHALSLAA